MKFSTFSQKTIELFETGYDSSVLREEFNLALEHFTADDWDEAAALCLKNNAWDGITYLDFASQEGWQDIVKKLIAHGTPVLHEVKISGKFFTPIHIAAQNKHYETVKTLVEAASKEQNWDSDDDNFISIAYKVPPEIFVALTAHINVHKEARSVAHPDWLSFVLYHRHDIFSYLLKHGSIKHTPMQDSGLNYLECLIHSSKNRESLPEAEIISALPLLLDAGLDLNHETEKNESALFLAIKNGQFNLARQLIESGKINLSSDRLSNQYIYTLLIKEKNFAFLGFLISKDFMTKITNEPKSNNIALHLWRSYLDRGKDPEILSFLLEVLPYTHKALNNEYKTIQRQIFGYFNAPYFTNATMIDELTPITYLSLFKENLPEGPRRDKKSALKYALSICYAIMLRPNTAVSLLGDFEKRISQKWESAHGANTFEKSMRCEFSMKEYVGLQWPVPLDHVTKEDFISKNGFLEKECFDFFRERGFKTDDAVKMHNAVFDGTFEKLISNVVPFTESSLNPHLLIHGKNIHNIGRILIMIAFEKGLIPSLYTADGKDEHITIKELFSAMVDPEFSNPESKDYAWIPLFDRRNLSVDTFSDPIQMHSHLMTQCNHSLPYLSALMTHSFCKAQLRLAEFVNDLTGDKWSTPEVFDRYVTMRIPNLISSDTGRVLSFLRKTNKYPQDSHPSVENPVQKHRFAKM